MHTKSRVEAAKEMHTGQGEVSEDKMIMLHEWIGQLDALAVQERCIPFGEVPLVEEARPGSGSE